ncbi:MAG: type II toxin-antitoxin system RelE/ParE family toxin [Candidatus Omnitrophica bacterium]|nr:type II toxin-antitoxin system RelE/ParE family toxin [Candidatus Omnitrophota bacterium]
MQNQERLIQVYVRPSGRCPFQEWIHDLKDAKTKAIVFQRIDRVRLGSFGDCRNLGKGVYELRIFFGPGLRVYYGLEGSQIVLLLCGGDKKSQVKDIQTAQYLWKEYQENA